MNTCLMSSRSFVFHKYNEQWDSTDAAGGRGTGRRKLAAAHDWKWGGVEHEPLVSFSSFFFRRPWGAPAGLNEHVE
jgi:hypothetical protein